MITMMVSEAEKNAESAANIFKTNASTSALVQTGL